MKGKPFDLSRQEIFPAFDFLLKDRDTKPHENDHMVYEL
jgi:hypothetical protein